MMVRYHIGLQCNKIAGLLLLLFVFLTYHAAGQTNDDANLEREIKEESNGYIYSEAVGDTQEEALTQARSLFRPYIETDELKNAIINWRGVTSSIVDSAQYLVKPRGNKIRAIVFLKRQDVPALIEKYSKQVPKSEESGPVVTVPTSSSNDKELEEMIAMIKAHPNDYIFAENTGTTRGRAEKSAQEQLGRPIMRIIADYPAINMDKDLIENIAYDTECIALRRGSSFYALAYIRISSFRCNLEKGITSGRSKCEDEVFVNSTHTSTQTSTTEQTSSESTVVQTTQTVITQVTDDYHDLGQSVKESPASTLLTDIMSIRTINELRDMFIANKNKGKLVYGQLSTMSNPENSYLVVFNDVGEILTFYGTGINVRKNLFKGAVEQYREAYPEGRFMWFQLFE